jgi:hypothetical protein
MCEKERVKQIRPFDRKGCLPPRPSKPAWVANPAKDHLLKTIRAGRTIYEIVPVGKRRVCKAWTFKPSAGNHRQGQIVRTVYRRKTRTRMTCSWGYDYRGRYLTLTGPGYSYTSPRGGGGGGTGSGNIHVVSKMSAASVTVDSVVWYLSIKACRQAAKTGKPNPNPGVILDNSNC